MRGYIPSKFKLPGPYWVEIKLVPRPFSLRTRSREDIILGEEDDAAWYVEKSTIYLWEGLTPRQRWLKLAHEFRHVANDYELWARQKVGAE